MCIRDRCKYGSAHDLHCVHGEVRIAFVVSETVFLDKTLHLQTAIFVLVLDALVLFHWRFIISQFKNPAKQNGNIGTIDAGAFGDTRYKFVRKVGVGAAKIKMEF